MMAGMQRWMGVLLVLAACESTSNPGPSKPDPGFAPPAPEIAVELAGVTLAEDCPDGVATKPMTPPAQPVATPKADVNASQVKRDPNMPSPGGCADPGNCHGPTPPACEQTAMQLSVKVPAGVAATSLKVKKVELLDDGGAVVGELTARAPSKWDGSAYVAWDEALPGGSSPVSASYKLTAPDWNKLTGGRMNAPSKRFRLRVTFAIGSKDRVVEKQSIVPAMPEPVVVT
jgi:hypothetical protein